MISPFYQRRRGILILNHLSPFARYHSDADSFPDYGAPSGSMGLGNVKGLNRQMRPLNTFTRAADTHLEPPSKKQRRDSSQSQRPHFFPRPSLERAPEQIQDGTSDDIQEIKSVTSSTSNQNPTASAGLPEYRNAQPKGDRPSRVRRSRTSQTPRIETGNIVKDSASPVSPDVLAIDGRSPSPARITSDVVPQQGNAKRSRQSSVSEPHVKRAKHIMTANEAIDISEDELQATSREDRVRQPSVLFAGSKSRQSGRLLTRGNINPTKFGWRKDPPAPREAIPPYHPTSPKANNKTMYLKKAVSMAHIWQAAISQGTTLCPIYRNGTLEALRPDPSNGEQRQALQEAEPWLHIDLDKVREIDHAATHSRFIRIRRRIAPNTAPALHLEFESPGGAAKFISLMPSSARLVSMQPDELEKMFHQAQKTAENWMSKNKAEDSKRQNHKGLIVELPTETQLTATDNTKRGKIKDRMLEAHADSNPGSLDLIESPKSPPAPRTTGPITRRTRQSSPRLDIDSKFSIPDPWTSLNPQWKEKWHKSLVYPATGRNRATVDAEDIQRLDEGEFLNDNLISFYVRYLQTKLEKEESPVLKKVYIFNSFFFDKLKSSQKYEGVKSWTAKVDLFQYDYIMVPVNEHAHWYLAIICNAAKTLPDPETSEEVNGETHQQSDDPQKTTEAKIPAVGERVKTISLDDEPKSPSTVKNSDGITISSSPRPTTGDSSPSAKPRLKEPNGGSVRKNDPTGPRIITLDSLDNPHSTTCRSLREYMADEARHRKGVELASYLPGMTAKDIPVQNNFSDCGVFVLGYMQYFLKDPDEAVRRLVQKQPVEWFIDPVQLRNDIRTLLFDLQAEQQERLDQEKQAKRQARKKKTTVATVPDGFAHQGLDRTALDEPPPIDAESAFKRTSLRIPAVFLRNPSPQNPTEHVPAQPSSSPAKMQRTRPSDIESDPAFVKRLQDDGDTSSQNDRTSEDKFYSAPSSPDASNGKTLPKIRRKRDGEPISRGEFVERILSSDSGNEREEGPREPSIRPSIEHEERPKWTSPRRRVKLPRPRSSGVESSYFAVKEPIEVDDDSLHGPKYDGIERSKS